MNYYFLKVNSLTDTFSIIEAGKQIVFSLDTALFTEKPAVFQKNDMIIGCIKNGDMLYARMLFTVVNNYEDGKVILEKTLEVSCGVVISEEYMDSIEKNCIVKVTREVYDAVSNSMIPQFSENKTNENEMQTCLDVERSPRTIKLHPLNLIIYGAPGTGKTYSTAEYAQAIIQGFSLAEFRENNKDRKAVMKAYNELVKAGQIVFTTFHQSYGYEEFIQGLRPDTTSEKMTFKTVDGVFKRIADRALNDNDNNYVIIIDEINRANISKVFGELITLIEDDKRWGEINQTSATLQSGDSFAVPNNLYIVGTMNSADKSISLIDAALRRRFEFIEQKPNVDLVDNEKLRGVLTKLNTKLADDLESSDLLIGHSYFIDKSEQELPRILNNSIIPLLYEYYYDNKKKVASTLKNAVAECDLEIIDDKMGRIFIEKR